MNVADLPARFAAKVRPHRECWIWIGATNSKGYGCLGVSRTPKLAHRFAYESLVGPIPEGLTIDHRCRNKALRQPRTPRGGSARRKHPPGIRAVGREDLPDGPRVHQCELGLAWQPPQLPQVREVQRRGPISIPQLSQKGSRMTIPPVVPDFRLIDVDEARQITHMSDRFLRDAIKSGDLPARKLGRATRIELADLIAWYRAKSVA